MIEDPIKEREYIMKINNITLSGFRNLKESSFKLEELIALIATNNYGKSNILTGIKFGIDFIKGDEKLKDTMMKWVKGIPLNKELATQNYKIEFEMSTDINEKKYIIQYGYELKWYRNDHTGQKIVAEHLKIKKEEDKRFSLYISRDGEGAFYKSSDSGRCSTKINIKDNELIVNKLKAFDNLFYIEIINRINEIKIHIERHLDASESYKDDPFIREDTEELDLKNTESIPRILYYLKKKHNNKYKLLINSFIQLFPEISDVQVEELKFKYNKETFPEEIPFKISNELYRIMVFDKNLNQPINFDSMSDGAKRIFLQLATIIIAEIQGYAFVAIEEPENSIHPMLFQSYLRIISEFKGDCKIIITSHSPYLLRYLSTVNIYVGVPNKNGIAKFSHIKKSCEKQLEKISNQFNTTVGDYVFELLNGNEEDVEELKELLEV